VLKARSTILGILGNLDILGIFLVKLGAGRKAY
jgi:hypothetical protein